MAKRILLGILFLLAALCLILQGLGVTASIGDVSVWQIILGLIGVYWLFCTLFDGHGLKRKLCAVLPLAFLFLVFERNIAQVVGASDDNLINNWIVIVAALLIAIAIELLFSGHHFKSQVHVNRGGDATYSNSFSSKVHYLDATLTHHSVKNTFGEYTVQFQNTDIPEGTAAQEIELYVENAFGEMKVCVPSDWTVDADISTSFGDCKVRPNMIADGRRLKITGKNSFGEVSVQ